MSAENTYYAYAGVEHQINRFFNHSLTLSHDNQLGFNAANLEGTHMSYSLAWKPTEGADHFTACARSTSTTNPSAPTTASLYHEKFTYVAAGLTALRQFGQHWRASLSWDYNLDDADVASDGYAQNIAKIELIYKF